MRCKHCGTDNPPSAKFCRACGHALAEPAPFSDDDPVPGADRKKRRGGRIALLVLAALLIAGGIVFRQVIGEFFARTFQSPEAYYQHVEARAANRFAKLVGEGYEAAFGADGSGSGSEASVAIAPSFPGLDWPDSIKLTTRANCADGVLGAETAIEVNDVALLQAEACADADTAAVRIPLLSDAALALDADPDATALIAALGKAKLTRAEVEGLTKTLLAAAAGQLSHVGKSAETLTAEGVSQRCAKLTVTIDEPSVEAVRTALREALENDGAAQKLLRAYPASAAADEKDLADALTEKLLGAVADGKPAEMTLWVGWGGAVRARAIALPDGGSAGYAIPISLTKGAAGLRCEASRPDGDAFTLTGTLRRETGEVSAAAVIDGDDVGLFTLRYSDLVWKQDNRSAAFELDLDRDVGKAVSVPHIRKTLGLVSVSGTVSQRGHDSASTLTFSYGGAPVAAADVSRSAAAPEAVTVPETILERGAWLRTAKVLPALSTLSGSLKEAGMPPDLLRTVLKLLTEQLLGSEAA